ncbi:MAG: NAD-dependent epimerase/dehydratase family protein [Bryobacteraceae bacterium]
MNNSADSFYRGRKVLVAGGLGFLGSNLARRLVELGSEVLVVDALRPNSGGNRANLKDIEDKLQIQIVDLRNIEDIAGLLPGHEAVFNLAGQVSHMDSMTDPVSDIGANVHATIALLDACRRHIPEARIVFASTRQVYGRPAHCPVDESHPLQPVDVNGVNKIAAESYHTLYHQVYGLQTVSLRLTNTYGPRMRIKDARQTFLGIWFRRVVEDGVFEVWGGQQKRDLSYVDDAVDAFLAAGALSNPKDRIFNLGGSPPVTLAELAESLVTIAGTGRFEIKEFPPALLRIDIGDYFADDRLFRNLTGWAPKVSLQEGLARSVAYYRNCLSDYV